MLAIPDTATVLGLRDRAILELLYSTGLRRQELIDLEVSSLDLARGVIAVRLGKGRKDRFVPVSRRAASWIARYLTTSRPALLAGSSCRAVFVTTHRGPMSPERMTVLVRRYVEAAALGKRGSCHLFRHTVATLMLEGGADLRFVQALLGHADISTTQLYTRVAIRSLQAVHQQAHPGSRPPKLAARPGRMLSSTGHHPPAPRRRGPRRARLER